MIMQRWRDDVRVSATGSGVDFDIVNGNVTRICVATWCNEHELDCIKQITRLDKS